MAKIKEQKSPTAKDGDSTKKSAINIGALLIEARSNLKLSQEDIAKQLNLSKDIISNLENNQFSEGLPLTFIRGYLISYAMKVGLDIKSIKQAFDNQMGSESVSLKRVESLSVFEKNRKDFNSNSPLFKWITFLIIIAVLFFAGKVGWEKYQSVSANNDGDTSSSKNEISLEIAVKPNDSVGNAEQVNNSDINALDNSSNKELDSSDTENNLTNSNTLTENNEPSSINVLPENSDVVNGELELNSFEEETPQIKESTSQIKEKFTLSFTDECWVRITDASGDELAFGIKKAEKSMSLEGVLPIEIILGDPSAAILHFKNEKVDLSQYRAKRRTKITLQ